MNVLMASGGTGGHIYPGITIAQTLKKHHPDVNVLFVGAEGGLEAELIPRAGFAFEAIPARYLRRRVSLEALLTAWTAWRGFRTATGIVKRFRPDVAVGTGGYVSGPVIAAAALLRVPTVIQEQNAFPGLTSRLLGRVARRIALGSDAARKYFPGRERVVVTGNPIRRDILTRNRREALAALGLDPERKTVLVFGGSQGGRSINEAVINAVHELTRRSNVQIVHQTGKSGFEAVLEAAGRGATPGADKPVSVGHWHIMPFIHDMPSAYAAADLVVCRAGAITLAELTARGVPAVLVPYPFAAERHQDANAAELAAAEAAVVVPDAELTGARLAQLVLELLRDEDRLARMAVAGRRLGRPDAADRIAALVHEVAVRGR